MKPRFFTVDEVNVLLPRVRDAIEVVTMGSERLEDLAERLYDDGKPGGDTLVNVDYARTVLALQKGIELIQQLGGEVKDFRQGLVDFRSMKDGREVLLCWVRGEQKVVFWHELHAGFAGRTAITEGDEFKGDSMGPQ